MKSLKRWTIKDGRVVKVDQFGSEPLSIKAEHQHEAENKFLSMARNVLFFQPRFMIKNNAFLLIYSDGLRFCTEAGVVDEDQTNSVLYHGYYDTLKEAMEDRAFQHYCTEGFQAERRAELEALEFLEETQQTAPSIEATANEAALAVIVKA